jgi:hypothetical protein
MFAASTTSLHILTTKKRHCFALVAALAKKATGGIPAFPPVKGKTQGKSNAGTGFSGGSGGGGGGGGGGGSDSGQANNPPPSGGNNNNSGNGGNPGDQASGGYGSGNSGGNAGSNQALPHLHLQAQAKRK